MQKVKLIGATLIIVDGSETVILPITDSYIKTDSSSYFLIYYEDQQVNIKKSNFYSDDFSSFREFTSKVTEIKTASAGVGTTADTEYKSPIDFTASYTSGDTISLSGLPFIITDSTQVIYVKRLSSTDKSEIYINGVDGIKIIESGNVLTIDGLRYPLESSDLFEVGINSQKKSYDPSTNSIMTSPLVNEWNQYTDAEQLVDAQNLESTFEDFGSEIDVRGYNKLGIYIINDVNDSENVDLKFLAKYESGGIDEFEINAIDNISLWTTSASDGKTYYLIDIETIPFIQLQAKAGTVGTTPGDLTIHINKKY